MAETKKTAKTASVVKSIDELRNKLAALPDSTIVYPGHAGLTTIGMERRRVIEAF